MVFTSGFRKIRKMFLGLSCIGIGICMNWILGFGLILCVVIVGWGEVGFCSRVY